MANTVIQDVELELSEMRRLGIRVSPKAFAYIKSHGTEIEEYRNEGMRISEIADLVQDLACLA